MSTDTSVNDATDAFDRKLESMRRAGEGSVEHRGTLDAAVYVHDTLSLALVAGRNIDPKATFADAIAVYDRIESERLRKLAEE
jgi:hypothetical protein